MRKWLSGLTLLIAASANAAIPSSQRDALVAIYNAAGGANWTDKTGWLGAPGTECDWFGVGCDETGSNVTNLDLGDNNLRGPLSPEIAKLPKLRDLQIYSNSLTGSLPGEIGQLADIEDIYINSNEFTGPIPPQLGALKKLELLGMSANHFSGPIPPALGGMSAMRELNLAANALSGSIPTDLASLTNLEVLNLALNQLNGAIPVVLTTLSKLRELDLSQNQFSGNIPPQLGNLGALQILYAGDNKFDGLIPPQLGQLHALEVLSLSNNQLSGAIPDALGDLGALQKLYLDTNKLTGPIPTALFRATALEELGLGDNQLTGPIPADVGKLASLQFLNLNANQLTGAIPVDVTTIAPLRIFWADTNLLTGAIPPEIGRLSNLIELDLGRNRLTGSLPRELGNLSKLVYLNLYDNQIGGTLPPELGQLADLGVFQAGVNQLTGTIPATLRNLTNLEQFNVGGNTLSGPLPVWIGELTKLQEFVVGTNQLTGTIPAGVAGLDHLYVLDVSQNFLTGPLPDFTHLGALGFANFEGNQLSGSIPASIGVLTNVLDARFSGNAFTGTLPHEIGNLVNVEYLNVSGNSIEGPIPAEIGALKKAYSLSMYGNRFSGTIPPQIGDMTNLQFLELSYNALRGPVPSAITKLTKLENGRSDFSANVLFTSDPAVRDFLNQKQGGNFEETQTVTPANVRVTQTTDRSATVNWNPIANIYTPGGYQVVASKSAGGPPAAVATTSSKDVDSIVVRNLEPSTTYFFTVSAVTYPFDIQQNLVVSDPSPSVQSVTGTHIVAPPEVVVTESPQGSVEIDGVEVVSDSFTLTNFGDAGTNVELERGDDFFTVEPTTFALAAGASKVVNIRMLAKPPGTYYGYVSIRGTGVEDGAYVTVILLAVQRPAGSVVATPISTRIELAGAPGSDSIGTAQFRNTGNADLRGILVSDQPWVQPDQQPITIAPGTVGSVNFRVVRARRPIGVEGALTANLTLVYVAGETQTLDVTPVNVSKVTVVDTTKPPVAPGSVPSLAAGEVAFFAPGVAALQKLGGSLGSDVSILNLAPAKSLSDLRLYFTAAGASDTKVATMPSVSSAQAVSLVNLVSNVYSAPDSVGTLQLRSVDWRNLAVAAKVTNVRGEGTLSGDVPVFRSDRAAGPNQPIILTGVRKPSDLYVQEAIGLPCEVRIEFVDAAGAAAGSALTRALGAFALLDIRDAVPAGATTAMVSISGGSGRVVAYARVADETNGDTWSVADWSKVNKFSQNEPMRIVIADGAGGATPGGGKRRRPVLHAVGATHPVTDLTLFNPATTEARAKVQVLDASGNTSEREVIVAGKTTMTVADAAASASTATAQIVVEPTRGALAVTARSYRSAARTLGAAIPVVSALAGLRVGQSQTFADLLDSTALTVAAARPATFRTGFGLVETAGAPATVRASVTIVEARSVVTARTTATREITLAPRQQIVLEDLVRAIAGPLRETEFGDLHGLQLQIEITGGSGAVVPFVIVTDNGSGDSLVRLE